MRPQTLRSTIALFLVALGLGILAPSALTSAGGPSFYDAAWSQPMNHTSYWEPWDCTKYNGHGGWIPAQYDAAVIKAGQKVRVYPDLTSTGGFQASAPDGRDISWVMKCYHPHQPTTTTTVAPTTTSTTIDVTTTTIAPTTTTTTEAPPSTTAPTTTAPPSTSTTSSSTPTTTSVTTTTAAPTTTPATSEPPPVTTGPPTTAGPTTSVPSPTTTGPAPTTTPATSPPTSPTAPEPTTTVDEPATTTTVKATTTTTPRSLPRTGGGQRMALLGAMLVFVGGGMLLGSRRRTT